MASSLKNNNNNNTLVPSVPRMYSEVLRNKPAIYWDYEQMKLKYGNHDDYELVRRLGRGKYSEVFGAVHVKTEAACVIKVLKAVKKKKIKREVKILQNLRDGPNIIKFFEVLKNPASEYTALAVELVHCVDHRTLYPTFGTSDIQYYMFRLLTALDYAHSHGIMHRDVKPHNVMIDPKRKILRLIDWGLAEFYHTCQDYNVKVASRYFKAPELLLDYVYYDYSIDMWSFGCMLAAIIFRREPFFQGADNNDQLVKIVKVLGIRNLRIYAKKYNIHVDPAVLESVERRQKRAWEDFVTKSNHDVATKVAIDLVDRLLLYDHSERLTAREALQHEYFLNVQPPSPDETSALEASTSNP
ncbi:casein kinase II subunit alpha [Galendromus occidentalis]|uniref:non-specific serine/threonine protein kinase n=1 Tax=Galendromus occidentalis TaxID=34638 RepID=A0AAJ6QTG4_9ACAR|nr:casein kinase II subunit alpha [Galendromus occidentalis]